MYAIPMTPLLSVRPVSIRPLRDAVVMSVIVLTAAFSAPVTQESGAQDPERVEGEAPADHELLSHVRGGAYFVARPLKERYDQLLARLRALKSEIETANIPGSQAIEELGQLQSQLADLRKEIEAKKVLVTPVQIHTESETIAFDLGPEQLLVVTADSLRVEDWDGPQLKCVLEKTVLAAPDQPADEHLKGIRLVHRHGKDADLVGQTDGERQADEEKFLASPDGRKLTEKQRESRRKLLREIADYRAPYREFQGHEFDALEIEGLTYEQGNRQMTIGVHAKNAGGSLGSEWQRHALLTIYVPACKAVALRGCRVALDVKGVRANLLVTGDDSRDRDYAGTFQIRDVHGSLTVDQVPIQVVENIEGNVSITATEEFSNTGTHHEDDWRIAYAPPPFPCSCRKIAGDFSASFGRFDLTLEDVTGAVNVRNSFGNTVFTAREPLAQAAQRLISESGRIEVTLSKSALGSLPVLALTNHGRVSTNSRRELLDETNFTTTTSDLGGRFSWRGMVSKANQDSPESMLGKFERPGKAWLNQKRSAGLDVISRGGSIVVKTDE